MTRVPSLYRQREEPEGVRGVIRAAAPALKGSHFWNEISEDWGCPPPRERAERLLSDLECSRFRAELDIQDVTRVSHEAQVSDIALRYGRTIRFIDREDDDPVLITTCVTYALQVAQEPTFRRLLLAHVRAGKDFMTWMMEGRLVSLPEGEVGSLICYLREGVWQHVGIVVDGCRIRSKWGKSPVYEHEAFDVPASYGDDVRYFQAISPSVATRLFVMFARRHQVPRHPL